MRTIYDWITVLIFAVLVTRFLQQSVNPENDEISFGHYLVASIACAGANWLGNNGWQLLAWAVIVAATIYIIYFVLPLRRGS